MDKGGVFQCPSAPSHHTPQENGGYIPLDVPPSPSSPSTLLSVQTLRVADAEAFGFTIPF